MGFLMSETAATGRIHYLDVLKGIGIVFVVFAHANSSLYGGGYLYSFHMVLFFFISGLLMNPGKYATMKGFLESRVKQLYIPFVVFYLLRYLYWLVVERSMRSIVVSPVDGFLGLFWGTDNMHWIYPGDVLWFVIGLFALEVVFYAIIKLTESTWLRGGILALLTGIGLLLAENKLYILPFSLNNVLPVIPFFTAGYLLRKPLRESNVLYDAKKGWLLLGVVPFAAFTVWQYPWICALGKQTDISFLDFPPYQWFYTIPFIEIGLWTTVSMLIGKSRFWEWLGRNTLPILAFHSPVARILIYAAGILTGLSKMEIRGDWRYSLLLTAASILCCLPLVYAWNWGYPRITARIFRKIS